MTSAVKPGSHSTEWLFCIACSLLLAACAGDPAPVQLAGDSMGTSWHVTYVAPDGALDSSRVQAGIESQLERVEQSMSTYRPESEISRLNDAPVDTWFPVSTEFYSVLSTALMVGRESRGAYDVTVGPLVDVWGFGPGGAVGSAPSQEVIDALKANMGQQHLRLDGEAVSVRKLRPLALDFSSLAKGFGVDLVANWLQSQGIERFLVEVGGEMRMAGLSHRGDPWHVAIEQPDSVARSVAAALTITDNAVATSGDYRNYFELEGRRYSHTIDPRTGQPVDHDLVSVTVVHPSAMVADAWATGFTVLGTEEAAAVAQQQGLAVYFIRRSGESLEHSHTAEFAPFLAVEN
jgi:thiamine biosynthesis lipoprotein